MTSLFYVHWQFYTRRRTYKCRGKKLHFKDNIAKILKAIFQQGAPVELPIFMYMFHITSHVSYVHNCYMNSNLHVNMYSRAILMLY